MTDLEIVSSTPIARAWGRLDSYRIRHARRAGGTVEVEREVYDHGSAAAVLLYDPAARTVLLTRQFRLPPALNGDEGYLIEAAAGLLDPGESPAETAARESVEETGHAPADLTFLFETYMSPGSLTEKVACFLGRYDGTTKTGAGGGLTHEGEDIEILELGFDEALAMTRDGRTVDAKTVLMLLWLALNPGWGL